MQGRRGRFRCRLVADRDGLAWWCVKYSKELSPEYRATYEHAETMAKLRRLGVVSGYESGAAVGVAATEVLRGHK